MLLCQDVIVYKFRIIHFVTLTSTQYGRKSYHLLALSWIVTVVRNFHSNFQEMLCLYGSILQECSMIAVPPSNLIHNIRNQYTVQICGEVTSYLYVTLEAKQDCILYTISSTSGGEIKLQIPAIYQTKYYFFSSEFLTIFPLAYVINLPVSQESYFASCPEISPCKFLSSLPPPAK